MDFMKQQIEASERLFRMMLQDHEERIRELEKARWQTAWITAFSSAALTALAVVLVGNLVN